MDPDAVNALFERHQTWAEKLAQHYVGKKRVQAFMVPDMVNSALIGLFHASARWIAMHCSDSDAAFRHYASSRVVGAMLDEMREQFGANETRKVQVRGRVEFHPLSQHLTEYERDRAEHDLDGIIKGLPNVERTVLRRRGDGLSQKAIGAELGVSESRVCQIQKQALSRLGVRMRCFCASQNWD
jgi:RNA polymerase sigma factor (sigma-70 family)